MATECLGGGLARDCEAAGGERTTLATHMKSLWDKVGFKPVSFELDIEEASENKTSDVELLDAVDFSAKFIRNEPTERDIEFSDGLTIKNISKSLELKEIYELLFTNGLPEDHGIDQIRINKGERNTWVVIEGLDALTD